MSTRIVVTLLLVPWLAAAGQVSRNPGVPPTSPRDRETASSSGQQRDGLAAEEPLPVFRLRTTSKEPTASSIGSTRGPKPDLTAREKLAIVKAAAQSVTSAETPVRLTASRPQVPNRAAIWLSGGELATFLEPDDGLITLEPEDEMAIKLWLPLAGKPHLLDCLVSARYSGTPLPLVIEVAAGWGKRETLKKVNVTQGWHHVHALFLAEKVGPYTLILRSQKVSLTQNHLHLRYCEITPFK